MFIRDESRVGPPEGALSPRRLGRQRQRENGSGGGRGGVLVLQLLKLFNPSNRMPVFYELFFVCLMSRFDEEQRSFKVEVI